VSSSGQPAPAGRTRKPVPTDAAGIRHRSRSVYLVLNPVVVVVAFGHVLAHPAVVSHWTSAMTAQHGNPLAIVAVALLVFPKLAPGLSGFETGVAVMPLITGADDHDPKRPAQRIRNTRKLLTTAALIMSGYLITGSLVTTWLIPPSQFQNGGKASGRALAYLAHEYLGGTFGTGYDASTVAILWFAGASAMAGLLNLIPRFCPAAASPPSGPGRYGHWC